MQSCSRNRYVLTFISDLQNDCVFEGLHTLFLHLAGLENIFDLLFVLSSFVFTIIPALTQVPTRKARDPEPQIREVGTHALLSVTRGCMN